MKEELPPFPAPLAAIWLTVGSWIFTVFVVGAFSEPLGPLPALGLGLVLGLGVTGTLAARSVPPPQAERMGMRGFTPRALAALLLLVPLVLLVSELDNILRVLLPAADAAGAAPVAPAAEAIDAELIAFEGAMVMVGLAPVVEEFFFRGVLQQGLVAWLGSARGVLGAAILYALGHGLLVGTLTGWLSATLGSLLIGTVLGYARLATGSVLASILLSMALSGAGLLAVGLKEKLPIPGFNGAGDHTPLAWLVPAALSIALGLVLLARMERATVADAVTTESLGPPRI